MFTGGGGRDTILVMIRLVKSTFHREPEIGFEELVKEMVESDLSRAKQEKHLIEGGFRVDVMRHD